MLVHISSVCTETDPNILRPSRPCQLKKTRTTCTHRVTGRQATSIRSTVGEIRRGGDASTNVLKNHVRAPASPAQSKSEGGGLGGGRRGPLRLIRRRPLDHVLA